MIRGYAENPARRVALALALWATIPAFAPGQEPKDPSRRAREGGRLVGMSSAVYDDAGLFNRDAVDQAESALKGIEKEYGVPTTVETIPSLKGEALDAVTLRHALKSGVRGVYLLIAKDDHKYDLIVSREFRSRIGSASQTATVKAALNAEFSKGNFDAGLNRVVESIHKILDDADRAAAAGTA